MGDTFRFVNFTKEQRLDLPSGKMSEILLDPFSQQVLTHYLSWFVHQGDECNMRFVGMDVDGWGETDAFDNVTADVLINMFETGFKPTNTQLLFIITKFQKAERMKDLAKWLEKLDEEGE